MSVSANTAMSGGHFVPFRMRKRGGGSGTDPVGTLHVNAEVTGDSSSGSVTATITGVKDTFGFPAMWVPTLIAVQDVLASLVNVRIVFGQVGNDRLEATMSTPIIMTAIGGVNMGVLGNSSVLIDSSGVQAAADVLSAIWPTNTDGFLYHLHVYGPVYDGQKLAEADNLPELLAGLR